MARRPTSRGSAFRSTASASFAGSSSRTRRPAILPPGCWLTKGSTTRIRRRCGNGRPTAGSAGTAPWNGFARSLRPEDAGRQPLNVKEGLSRPGSATPAVGGCFDFLGFSKYYRRLATPVRMDLDGTYYLSFLFRRQGPPADPLNAVGVLLRTGTEIRNEDPRKRLNIGIGGVNQLFTHLNSVGSRTPLPLDDGQTYLLAAKIATRAAGPDQVFLRVYGPKEAVERQEPDGWTVAGPPLESDLVFDWLEVHINSLTRQTIDEVRLGTTWASVAAPGRRRKKAARERWFLNPERGASAP